MHVLVVEDNPGIARSIRADVAARGHDADLVETGAEALWKAEQQDYDVIVLDMMLPDVEGASLCRSLRRRGVHAPILMLTVLAGTNDKVRALEAGADDYLVKPYDTRELIARLQALVRRASPASGPVLRFADVLMDLDARTVTRAGRPIELRNKEFRLLEHLLRNPGRVLTRTAIAEHVWEAGFGASGNVIEVYVSMLRRKLGEPGIIQTVIGVGYRLQLPEESRVEA